MGFPERAMVLGAGFGERMRPLTDIVPKPMVELDGKPLIDHVLERLGAAGVKSAVVNVHYLADKLEAHLQSRTGKPEIKISDEREQLLDTGGGTKKALADLGGQPFFVHNSDSVWVEKAEANLTRMGALWDEGKMDCLLLLAQCETSIGYTGAGDFDIDDDDRVCRRGEGEEVPFVYAGVCIVHPKLFADAPDGAFSMNVLWDRVLAEGRLFGMRHDGIWMHVGTPQALDEAQRCIDGG